MKDNLSKFKPAAALITVLLGIALLASCTGQNNIEQNSERIKKNSADTAVKKKNNKAKDKKSNTIKDYYMAVPADLFYEKKGVLILDKNFQDKKYLPDIEIEKPFLISKNNIYAKDSYNLCPGIYSLKDEDWVYKADKLYSISDFGNNLTLVNTNDTFWYYYDDESGDIEKIKKKYGDILPEDKVQDNYILDEKGRVLFNLPGGTTQRFGDYIWATVTRRTDDMDIENIGINIYDLKGNLINAIEANEGGGISFDNAYGELRLNDSHVIADKFNYTEKVYIDHKILYSPSGDEELDLLAASREFIGKDTGEARLTDEFETEIENEILLIEFYYNREDRYYSIFYDCKSRSILNRITSRHYPIKFKTAGKSFIIFQLEDGSYNVFEDGVLKRRVAEKESELLKEELLIGEADIPLSLDTEASTDTDLVLYDIVRGETLRFKHNNQLKASDFENHLIYLTELGPACDKITLRNQADEEDTGKDYLTDREVLFYKDEYIAQGTYVDHRQETNIRKSDEQGKGYTYIIIYEADLDSEADTVAFQGFLTDKGELIELNNEAMENKTVLYYGENFYICLHGSSIECRNFQNKLLRREYKNYDEENIGYY